MPYRCVKIHLLYNHDISVVTGGGSLAPSGLSFPGAYTVSLPLSLFGTWKLTSMAKATDPGILFSPYQGDAANAAYKAPGGSVYPGLN